MGHDGSPLDLDLREYVTNLSREMTERLTHLQAVIERVAAENDAAGSPLEFCPLVDCRARRRYRAAVQEAVKVLDQTRRSFKSRQLEELRRMLEAVLSEDRPSGTGTA